ncbi:MAG TPA: LuxR C-terminal-related transcriptional regulator [Jiangellaceae bacterium]
MPVSVPQMPSVERGRLLDRIETDVERGVRVIVVSAPAGSGKSTLLRQWSQRRMARGELVASVNVERGDAPKALLPDVIAAIRAAAEESHPAAALGGLRRLGRGGAQGVAGALSAAVESLDRPLWLVIDDAHDLAGKAALEALAALTGRASARFRIVVGARFTLPAFLPRLQLDGLASQVRMADLAFERDEAEALLSGHDVHLDDADVDVLLERTEGWAAGLMLAAAALVHEDDPAKFVANFAGDDHAVADYLVSEVLWRIRPEVLDLLLATAVVGVVDAELAGWLSGRTDAGQLLHRLEADNALVQPVAHLPGAYACHPLLRTYLLAESARRDVGQRTRMHVAAAEWFARTGRPAAAIEHAVAGDDWPRAVQLIGRHGVRILLADGPDAVRPLIDHLPPEVRRDGAVPLVAALVALSDRDHAAACRELDAASRDPSLDADPDFGVIRAAAALGASCLGGEPPERIAELLSALGGRLAVDPDVQLLASTAQACAWAPMGDYARAESGLIAVSRLARRDGHDHLLLECMAQLCAVAAIRCDVVAMAERADETVEFAATHGWTSLPGVAFAHAALALVAWQSCDEPTAATSAAVAASMVEPGWDPLTTTVAGFMSSITTIAASTAAVPRPRTVEALRAATGSWERMPPSCVATAFGVELGLAQRRGDLGWAADVVERASIVLGADAADVRVLRATVHVRQGRESAARVELAPVLAGEEECLAVSSRITAQVCAAHVADHAGEPARAHAAVRRALEMAAPLGMTRCLADATPRVRSLLVRNRGRFAGYEDFVADVLAVGADPDSGTDLGSEAESLTARELDLLRDLPSLLSLREIADAHVVSVNTVKTHLKAVYRKLGAATRREAVDQARHLGLL